MLPGAMPGSIGGLGIRSGEFAQLFVQSVAVDAQSGRSFDLHVVAQLHHLLDQFPLDATDEPVVKPTFIGRQTLNAGADQVLNQGEQIAAFHPAQAQAALLLTRRGQQVRSQ